MDIYIYIVNVAELSVSNLNLAFECFECIFTLFSKNEIRNGLIIGPNRYVKLQTCELHRIN